MDGVSCCCRLPGGVRRLIRGQGGPAAAVDWRGHCARGSPDGTSTRLAPVAGGRSAGGRPCACKIHAAHTHTHTLPSLRGKWHPRMRADLNQCYRRQGLPPSRPARSTHYQTDRPWQWWLLWSAGLVRCSGHSHSHAGDLPTVQSVPQGRRACPQSRWSVWPGGLSSWAAAACPSQVLPCCSRAAGGEGAVMTHPTTNAIMTSALTTMALPRVGLPPAGARYQPRMGRRL